MNALTCRKCGNALQQPATGRPPTYCSKACRRAAEYEITRINRHLEKLESERIRLNITDRSGMKDYLGRSNVVALADTQRNIDELETRLLLLLGENEHEQH
ncbi:MAG: hypothetical protein WBN08_20625 [Thiogranum sp.]